MGKLETVRDFIFLGSKIPADGDCSHEMKRQLFLGGKTMSNLDSTLKSRDTTLPAKVHIVKAVVFPVVMYGCEWNWKSLSHAQFIATPWSPWNSPGQNTGVGSLSLLQGIFPTQGTNPGLPHCRRILYQLSHKDEIWTKKKAECQKKLMLLNLVVVEDSWESLGLHGDQTSQP